jgi:hypothetical protein
MTRAPHRSRGARSLPLRLHTANQAIPAPRTARLPSPALATPSRTPAAASRSPSAPRTACTRAWHHALNPLFVIKSIARLAGVQARRLITSRLIEALLRRAVVWDRDRVTWDAIF